MSEGTEVASAADRRQAAMLAALVALLVVGVGAVYKMDCGTSVENQYLRACYSDIPPLYLIEGLDQGKVPYVDHPVEYPVLTGAQMWLVGGMADGPKDFFRLTVPLLALGAAVAAWLLAREIGLARALVFAASPTLLLSGVLNWDLPSVALAVAGVVAHRRGRDGWAGGWLGLGTAAKLWPGFLLLALVPAAWAARGQAAGVRTAVAAGGSWLAVNLPFMIVAWDGWWRFFGLSSERPIDWDPTWALLTRWTGWMPAIELVNVVSGVLFLVGGVVIVVATARRLPPERWFHALLPLLVWFLVTNKVYSPQFSLWLLPFMALTFPGWGWVAAFGVADVAVTVTRFPHLGNFVVDGGIDGAWPWWPFGTALTVRYVVLIALTVVAWRRATRGSDPARVHPPDPAYGDRTLA